MRATKLLTALAPLSIVAGWSKDAVDTTHMTEQPPLPPTEMPDSARGLDVPPERARARRPWSVPAVLGFGCSLLGCLGVTAVLGLILGIVGVVNTSGNRRRGRGLAVAAIPISVVAGVGFVMVLFVIMVSREMVAIGDQVRPVLAADAAGSPESVSELREFTSESFDKQVSDEKLAAWLKEIEATRGKLASLVFNPQTPDSAGKTPDGKPFMSFDAKFVTGPTTVKITYGVSGGWHVTLDDIAVGGVSPRTFEPSAQSKSSPP